MDARSHRLRAQVEQTRDEIGDTVDALVHKANVPGRTKAWLVEKKEAAMSTVSRAISSAESGASSLAEDAAAAAPDAEQVRRRASRMKRTAERNPLGLALGGAALGFLAGLVAPSTRAEDERLGPVADRVKQASVDAGQQAVERGAKVAGEAVQAAAQTAEDRAREEGEELSAELRERAIGARPAGEPSPPRGV